MSELLFSDPRGPIESFTWGEFIIEGLSHIKHGEEVIGAGKDIRLIGTDVSTWEERQGHKIASEMITGVYGQDIETLIIGVGIRGAMRVPQKTLESIRSKGIPEIILERTPNACRYYNLLYHQGKRVALLAHGTC